MGNLFVNLPVPAQNGVGAAVDVSAMGVSKSIVVDGDAQAQITVEVNNDAAQLGSWSALKTFQNAGELVVDVACRWMRVRVANYNVHVGGTSQVDVGSTDDGTSFQALAVPSGNGSAPSSNTSALPLWKTVQCGGKYRGAVIVEVSEDGGTSWAQPFAFQSQSPAIQSVVVAAELMRVRRVGVPKVAPGLPIVNIAACEVGGGGGTNGIGVDRDGVPIGVGPFTELDFVGDGVTATDAGGGIAIITVSGSGGSSNSLIFRPGSAATGPVVFDTWADLMTRLASLRASSNGAGQYQIQFDDSLTSPAVVPTGTYDMSDVTWEGRDGQITSAQIATGTVLLGLRKIRNLLRVDFAADAAMISDFTTDDVLWLSDGAQLSASGTAAPIQYLLGAGSMTVILQDNAILANNADKPVVRANAIGGTVHILLAGADSEVQSNTLSSAVGAFVVLETASSAIVGANETQASIAGTLTSQNSTKTRLDPTPKPPLPPIVGNTVLSDANEVVLVDPTGGPIQITLPAAFNRRGQLIIVKDISTGINAISVVPAGGNTIDGGGSAIVNISLSSVTLVSDGVSNWIVVASASPVQHDATLAGDGTGASPLAVANALNQGATGKSLTIGDERGNRVATAIAASQDDFAPVDNAKTFIFDITPSGAFFINGLVGGVDGRQIIIHNSSAVNTLFIKGEAGTSLAVNRFKIADEGAGAGFKQLPPNDSTRFYYDGTAQRWIEQSSSVFNNLIINTLATFSALTALGTATFAGNINANGGVISLNPTSGSTRVGDFRGSTLADNIAADKNDYVPPGAAPNAALYLFLTPTGAPRTITGLTGGAAERILNIFNPDGANSLTLTHQDVASAAANRFICPGGVGYVILPGKCVSMIYNSARWTLMVQ